jgi:hypothetical protein
MARKRMIDPSIWADERFGRLSSDAQVMFIGIISNADDEGRLPGNAAFLGATIFPFRGLTADEARDIRSEVLTVMRSARLYIVEDCEYIQLDKFRNYQVINKPTKSKYPSLPEDYGSTTVVLPPNRIEKKLIEGLPKSNTSPLKTGKTSGNSFLKEVLQPTETWNIAKETGVTTDVVKKVYSAIQGKPEFSNLPVSPALIKKWIRSGLAKGWYSPRTADENEYFMKMENPEEIEKEKKAIMKMSQEVTL